jgi:hypothetical protein
MAGQQPLKMFTIFTILAPEMERVRILEGRIQKPMSLQPCKPMPSYVEAYRRDLELKELGGGKASIHWRRPTIISA